MDKVSIIVPVYNGEKTIEECLNSIASQEYENYEVLIVDDGSSDGTSEICNSYTAKDNRFHYYKKKNGGVSSARNYALKRASGSYVFFVDCDDTINSKYISLMMRCAKESNADIVISKVNIVSRQKSNKTKYGGYSIMNSDEFLTGLISGRGLMSGCCNKGYRRQTINGVVFSNYSVGEDLLYNYDIVNANDGAIAAVCLDCKLYNYRIGHNESVMHGAFSRKNLEIVSVYETLMSRYARNNAIRPCLEASFVFIAIKIIIKMVASSYNDEELFEKLNDIVKRYKNKVYTSNSYSLRKKICLMYFAKNMLRIERGALRGGATKRIAVCLNRRIG